jgi:hypothetical protein
MLSIETLRKAQLELTRLNRELHALHLDEERCKLRRSRLEGEKARVQSLVDICELAQRLSAQPGPLAPFPGHPDVHVLLEPVFPESPNGPQFVGLSKPLPGSLKELRARGLMPSAVKVVDDLAIAPVPPRKAKPDGLPTTPDMIATTLREVGRPIRPSEIAAYIRRKWWAELPPKAVYTNAYRMAKDGRLTTQEGRYSINGGSHE